MLDALVIGDLVVLRQEATDRVTVTLRLAGQIQGLGDVIEDDILTMVSAGS